VGIDRFTQGTVRSDRPATALRRGLTRRPTRLVLNSPPTWSALVTVHPRRPCLLGVRSRLSGDASLQSAQRRRRTSGHRPPVASPALRVSNLGWRHVLGGGVPVLEGEVVAASGCEGEPHVREDEV